MSDGVATERRAPGVLGAAVPRKEDDRLLQGDGRFTDDVEPARSLHMAVGRCPFPHARVESIDVAPAVAMPGVHGVFTGVDVAARTEPISVLRPVPGAVHLPFYALAQEVCVFEGQPVVSVIADSRQLAEDAVEAIWIDYEPLDHVTDTLAALEPGAPVLHPRQMDDNLLVANPQHRGDAEKALQGAAAVVEGRFHIGRVSPLPMEPRAIVAEWRPGARELTAHVSTQVPHLVRMQLAESLRLDEGDVRVVTGDVGGGFGLKLGLYPEELLACLHAIDARRPVKWTEDRLEHFRASTHGRESVHEYRVGADAEGNFVAMTDRYTTDLGGQNSPFGSAQLSSIVFSGPYRVEDGEVERRVALTNKTPIGAYRGYGQPEVDLAREVLIDRLARKLEIDPLEIRMRNLLTAEELPWRNAAGAVYDSGDYPRCLQMVADAIDYEGLRAAGRGPGADGRYRGIGFTAFVERTGYASAKFLAKRGSRFGAHESVTLRANRSGGIDLFTGVSTFGQSNETAFAQVCAEVHGIDFDAIRVHAGDTRATPLNTGAFASRTLIAGAGAVRDAALMLRDKTLRIAAGRLEVDVDELEIAGDAVVARADPARRVSLVDVHTAAIVGQGLPEGEEPGLESTAHFEPEDAAYAYGSAAAVVAVDAETGEFEIERFVLAHDSGRIVNPKAVEGQVRGALAQGFGAALTEELRYEADSGQLVNGTMLDYFVPTASDMPRVELLHTEVPSPVTPFGVRGVGETGTIPPGAAVANAICDALAEFDVEISSLPITPESVWRAIRKAGNGGDGLEG
ncbi:MAG TPA: xanthine dehydrogenase family protein molybdopterin-binding subunit [Solirubrobacterales bacterium]|nr:xanthine dehydrogenase family protein molybdopterin-binding subunit [Solirubrobacterales bacterium]